METFTLGYFQARRSFYFWRELSRQKCLFAPCSAPPASRSKMLNFGIRKKECLQQNPTHALMFNEDMEMDAAAMEADEEGMFESL